MKIKVFPCFIFIGLLSGCSTDVTDLEVFVASAKTQPSAPVTPSPEFVSVPSVQYEVKHLRSPFAQLAQAAQVESAKRLKNCLTPDFTRSKDPLEVYGIDAIQLQGTIQLQDETGVTQRHYALLTTNDGQVHKVQNGDFIGLYHGKIIAVDKSSITVRQMIPDGTGCFIQQSTTITLNNLQLEQDNV